jgi:hypothetical protein
VRLEKLGNLKKHSTQRNISHTNYFILHDTDRIENTESKSLSVAAYAFVEERPYIKGRCLAAFFCSGSSIETCLGDVRRQQDSIIRILVADMETHSSPRKLASFGGGFLLAFRRNIHLQMKFPVLPLLHGVVGSSNKYGSAECPGAKRQSLCPEHSLDLISSHSRDLSASSLPLLL